MSADVSWCQPLSQRGAPLRLVTYVVPSSETLWARGRSRFGAFGALGSGCGCVRFSPGLAPDTALPLPAAFAAKAAASASVALHWLRVCQFLPHL